MFTSDFWAEYRAMGYSSVEWTSEAIDWIAENWETFCVLLIEEHNTFFSLRRKHVERWNRGLTTMSVDQYAVRRKNLIAKKFKAFPALALNANMLADKLISIHTSSPLSTLPRAVFLLFPSVFNCFNSSAAGTASFRERKPLVNPRFVEHFRNEHSMDMLYVFRCGHVVTAALDSSVHVDGAYIAGEAQSYRVALRVRQRSDSGEVVSTSRVIADVTATQLIAGTYVTVSSLLFAYDEGGNLAAGRFYDPPEGYLYLPDGRFVHPMHPDSPLRNNPFLHQLSQWPVVRSSRVHSYHNGDTRRHPAVTQRLEAATRSYERMYGCEVEVHFKSSANRNMWLQRHPHEMVEDRGTIYERDGSLDPDVGLEIITAPYTLRDLQNPSTSPIHSLFDTLDGGLQATPQAGLHVNCSLAGVDKRWVIGRMGVMVQSLQLLFETLARRKNNRYARYETIGSDDRYAAVADRRSRIEIRIFAGVTDRYTVLESVELADALFMWCEHPNAPVKSASTLQAAPLFRSWIRRNHERYPTLAARLGGAESSAHGFVPDPQLEDNCLYDGLVWPENIVHLSNAAL